jgi:hypothetical protein
VQCFWQDLYVFPRPLSRVFRDSSHAVQVNCFFVNERQCVFQLKTGAPEPLRAPVSCLGTKASHDATNLFLLIFVSSNFFFIFNAELLGNPLIWCYIFNYDEPSTVEKTSITFLICYEEITASLVFGDSGVLCALCLQVAIKQPNFFACDQCLKIHFFPFCPNFQK